MPNVPISELCGQTVTHIVSLGPRCATTFNLRRHYNFASAYPFDWWITPPRGIVEVLEKMDADWIYDPKNLCLTDLNSSVVHSPTGILLHHEFPRDELKHNMPVIDNFVDFINLPRSRTEYLFEKFLSLNRPENRVVFVREEGVGQELEYVLSRRFSKCTWSLLRIPSIPEDEHGWMCDPAKWDALLAPLHLTLEPSQHRPFEATTCEHVEADFAPKNRSRQIPTGKFIKAKLYAVKWFRFFKSKLAC
jgi:hypothetical protein